MGKKRFSAEQIVTLVRQMSCVYRLLDSRVSVMQSAKDGTRFDGTQALNGATVGRILGQVERTFGQ